MTQLIKGDLAAVQNAPINSADEPLNLTSIFARFLRRLSVFAVIASAIMIVDIAVTLTTKPTYTAVASVVIKHQSADVVSNQPQTADRPTDPFTVDTEVSVLQSRPLAVRVVRRLNLERDPEFNPGLLPPRRRLFGLAPPAHRAAPVSEDQLLTNVTNAVLSHLKVRRNGLTYQIDVAFSARSADTAAAVANALTEEYLKYDMESKYDAIHRVTEFVDDRLQSLAKELETNEAAVQQYKITHNLVSAQGATLAEQDLSSLNVQIATARADFAEKQARLSAARDQINRGGGGDLAAALGSQVIQQLRTQRADLLRQQAEFSERYGPLHPKVTQVQRQLGENERQIQEEISRIVSNLEAEVKIAQQRANSLAASRGSAEGSLGSNSKAAVGLNDLQRKADASRVVYEQFLNRSKDSTAQEGLQRPDARISSPAQAPLSPSKPNKPVNLALGFLLAVGAGIVGVLLAENLDSAFLTSKDVENKLGIACIGAIPLLTKIGRISKNDYVLEKPFSGFAEAFRGMRACLKAAQIDRPIKVVAITSALPEEGKTLTTLAFGRGAAQAGLRVLLIDCDLRRKQLTRSFGQELSSGLVELLENKTTLLEAIRLDGLSGASLLLLSAADAPTADLLGSAAFHALLETLRERFDLIVIDTAPVLAVAETRLVAAEADATIFLTRWAKTSRNDAEAALDLLAGAGAFIAGVCLTQVDMAKQARFGYGDKMYSYNKYSKYYAG